MSTAEKVRAAADYIDRTGLHKGSMFEVDGYVVAEQAVLAEGIKCCTIGALDTFGVNTDEVRLALGKKVGAYIAYAGDWRGNVIETDNLPDWNDAPERTKEDVVNALRELADDLERAE